MKASEFKRWLKRQGCTFVEGTRHTIVSFRGRSTTLPRHHSQELGKGTVESIMKQLDLKKTGE